MSKSLASSKRAKVIAEAFGVQAAAIGTMTCLLFYSDYWYLSVFYAINSSVAMAGWYIYFCVLAMRQPDIRLSMCVFLTGFTVSFLFSILLSFASIYHYYGILGQDQKLVKDPLTCLYFSAITWTTVGYGDFVPSPSARFFAACEAVLGYLFMGFLLAAMVHILTRLTVDPSNTSQQEHE